MEDRKEWKWETSIEERDAEERDAEERITELLKDELRHYFKNFNIDDFC